MHIRLVWVDESSYRAANGMPPRARWDMVTQAVSGTSGSRTLPFLDLWPTSVLATMRSMFQRSPRFSNIVARQCGSIQTEVAVDRRHGTECIGGDGMGILPPPRSASLQPGTHLAEAWLKLA